MNDVIDAIKNGKTRELREQYRKLDFLIIDDLQYIAGKPSTTDEFYYMLNDVLTAGAQVVISADRPLEDLDFPDNVKKKLLQSTIMVMN